MPSYEFECPGGGTVQTVTASIFDEIPAPHCLLCGAKMRRIYNTPGVIWNAQGFYKTGG